MLGAEKGKPGEAYFVTDGEPQVFRDFVTRLVGTQGVEIPDRSMPHALAQRRDRGGGGRVARAAAARPAAADQFRVLVPHTGLHDRHLPRPPRAWLQSGHIHRRRYGGVAQRMRIAVGSDHAGFHLKEHVAAGARGTGSRRRRRRHRLAGVRRLPALRRGGQPPRRRGRCRAGHPGLRVRRRRLDRRQQGRRRARGQRARRLRGGDGPPPQRRERRDAQRRPAPARAGRPIVAAFLRTAFEGGRHARRVGQIADVERGRDSVVPSGSAAATGA